MGTTRQGNEEVSIPLPNFMSFNSRTYCRIRQMFASKTPRELKDCFREGFQELGYFGFCGDRSMFEPLSDEAILSGKDIRHSKAARIVADSETCILYNDISDRCGQQCGRYMKAICEAAERHCMGPFGEQVRRYIRRRKTPFMTVADAPHTYRPLLRTLLQVGSEFGQPVSVDRLTVPLETAGRQTFFLCLLTSDRLGLRDLYAGIALATCYHQNCLRLMTPRPKRRSGECGSVVLRRKQLECVKWAVAGKTIEDIAELTGLHRNTVRYHMEQARKRYGYATIRQTLVRAAVDYGLDPMGA